MRTERRCGCDERYICPWHETRAEERAEERELGDPISDADWDRLEAGAWWNYAPGMEPRAGW